MRKKEVRWISRDKKSNFGFQFLWDVKPTLEDDGYYRENGNLDTHLGHGSELKIKLKKGGLAKVTIERQY